MKSISTLFVLISFLFLISQGSFAVTYYSAASNAPNTLANWWTNANGTGTHPANFTTAGDVFTIQSGHNMTATASWTVTGNTIIINNGGTLTGSSNFTVTAGSITVNGTYANGSTGRVTATITVGNTGSMTNTARGGSITGTITVNGTFSSSTTLTITGSVTVNGTYNKSGTRTLTVSSGSIIVNGTFNNGGTGTLTGTLVVNNGGLYKHTTNGGSIPSSTWNTGSTCEVSGTTNSAPSGLNKSFYNFKWSAPNTTNVTFSPVIINGNLDITNGNGGQLQLGTTNLTIGGNLTISTSTNAYFAVGSATARAVTVNGDISITTGTLNLSTGSNVGTLNVNGNFTHSGGTITESSTGSGLIVFKKTGTQTYTSGGTLSQTINFKVNSGSILQMGTGASPATISSGSIGTFTLSSGATLGVTSTAGITTSGATGNIQVTGARTYSAGANYIFNGNANQSVGNGFTQNKANNVEINNPGRTVSLGSAAAPTIVGSLLLTAGTLNLNGNSADVGDIQGSGNITTSVAGAVTLTIGSTNNTTTYSGVIQNGSGTVSVKNTSTGTLTLGGANTYSGATTVNDGTIRLGVANALSASSNITLSNATISTGAATGYTSSAGTLNLAQNSTIALGTGVHTLTFANSSGVAWPTYVTLTITGWMGGYNGTTGTAGKIFVGAGGLTAQQLGQLQFQNGTDCYPAMLLGTGEVVPKNPKFVLFNLSYPTPNYFVTSVAITPLVPTVQGTPTSYTVSPALPTGLSLNTSTGVISGTPTSSTPVATYQVTATDGTNSTKFGIDITVHLPGNYYARQNGNWDTPSTWSLVNGSSASPAATTVPVQGDVVYIGDINANGARTVTIPIGYDAACTTLNLGSTVGYANNLTMFDATTTLAVSGNLTITRSGTNSITNSLNINAGAANVGGNFTISGASGGSNRITQILITTGSLSITGNLDLSAGSSAINLIDMSGGAGTLNLGGAFSLSSLGTLTPGTTSTVNFNGSVAQTIPIGVSNIVYNNLNINNLSSNGATLSAQITSTRVTGDLNVQSGILNNGGFAVALNSTNFSISDGATFNLTGTSTMVSSAATKTFEPLSTTNYSGTTQTVTNETYGNLILSGSGAKTMSGATIQGDFTTSGTASVTAGGILAVAGDVTIGNGTTLTAGNFAHTVGGNWVNNGTYTPGAGTVTFSGTNQSISGTTSTTFNNLSIGDASVLDAGSYNITVNGNWVDDGDFVPGTGTVTFATATTHTLSGTTTAHVFNNLSIGASSVLDVTSNDISLTGNWVNGGTFTPGTGTVTFNGSGTQSVSGTASTTFNNLTIPNGNTLTAGSYNFALQGDWVNNGTFTPGTGTVTFTGSTSHSLSGTSLQTFNNLTIVSPDTVTIPAPVNVTVTGTLTNYANKGLVLQSNATGSASLIHGTANVPATVERYMDGNQWHNMASAVSGQTVNGFVTNGANNIPVSGTKYGMEYYSEGGAGWTFYTTSSTPGNLVPGNGYMVRNTTDGVVRSAGSLTAANTNVALTRTNFGWNSVGNPFPCSIGVRSDASTTENFLTKNAAQFDPSYAALYVWDGTAYKIVSNAGFTPPGGNAILDIAYMQPGQGFIIKSKTGGATVSFTQAMRLHENTGSNFKSALVPWPGINMKVSSATKSASTAIALNEKMTKGLDPTFDAGQFGGDATFKLYSRLVEDNGINFALQCLPVDAFGHMRVPLGFDCAAGGQVTFSADVVPFPDGIRVFLVDSLMGEFIDFSSPDASYSTTIAPGTTGIGRFYLNITGSSASGSSGSSATPVTTIEQSSFEIYSNGQEITVKGAVKSNTQANLYDLTGKLLKTYTLQPGNLNILPASDLSLGVYFIRVVGDGVNKSQKILLE